MRLATDLLAEGGCREPAVLAEQLVTLADGAASPAMVLGEPDYGSARAGSGGNPPGERTADRELTGAA
ncbi:hypothetical protein [Streptomyces albidoflavus]|uniref:hypothetical protein n=1 Tax=Streptomyces albidoflavus TaxID=1886 RepID=UPI0033A69E96